MGNEKQFILEPSIRDTMVQDHRLGLPKVPCSNMAIVPLHFYSSQKIKVINQVFLNALEKHQIYG